MQALQEFKELSEEYSEEEMVTLLPYWTSVYTKLALDCEGRVREQSHGCLLSVVSKVGRQLAPHLPQLPRGEPAQVRTGDRLGQVTG